MHAAESDQALNLRVAEVVTRVVCDEPARLSVSGAACRFLVPDGRADVTLGVRRATHLSEPHGEKLFDSGGVWRLYREEQDFIFSFTSSSIGAAPYRLARLDAAFTRGTVWFNSSYLRHDAVLRPLEYPLDELLMLNRLAKGQGVEIHGCGVIDRDGTAYLFAGQSGAGKSTLARLWHQEGATILSDDRVVLRARDGEVQIYGTPWHGEEEFASPASALLKRIFFIDHGPDHRARRVRPAGAAARLFTCSFPPFHDRAGLDFTLELLAAVVDRVPSLELAFTPDRSVVGFVRTGS